MPKFIPSPKEDPMRTLCRMVTEMGYEDLPIHVIDSAKRFLLDVMAVTIGGSSMEGIREVVGFVKEKGGKKESLIPFYGGRVPASEAAFAIGPMTRAMDFGPVHERGGVHCSEYVFPPLLAATGLKGKVSGKEFIAAFALGEEILLRIGLAYNVVGGAIKFGRYVGNPIFGCVAAVGKLIGLEQDELENAQGIALQMTQPHMQLMYHPATLMVRVHHGFIGQDAINACLLAKRGITGPRQGVLDEKMGFLGFARWETKPEEFTRGLGEEWEMTQPMMKPYTGCKVTHSSIYGIIDQMKQWKFKPEDVASIEIEGQLAFVSEPREQKWNPQTIPDCQFSLPFTVATAVYDGDVFMNSFTPEAMKRKKVRELMKRISAKENPDLPFWAAKVNTTLVNGEKHSKEYIYIKGHPKNPLTEEDLVNKFRKCVDYSAYKISKSAADSVMNSLLHLEKVDDVAKAILLPLTPR